MVEQGGMTISRAESLTFATGNGARFLSLPPDFGISYRLQKSHTDTKLHIVFICSLVSVFM
jgi:hypothetical protein